MSFSISNCRSSARWRNACFSKYLKETWTTKGFLLNHNYIEIKNSTYYQLYIMCSLVWRIQYTGQWQQTWILISNNCVPQISDLKALGNDFASSKSNKLLLLFEKLPENMPELSAVHDNSSSFKFRTHLIINKKINKTFIALENDTNSILISTVNKWSYIYQCPISNTTHPSLLKFRSSSSIPSWSLNVSQSSFDFSWKQRQQRLKV